MTLDTLHQAMVDGLRNAKLSQCFGHGQEDTNGEITARCASIVIWHALLDVKLINGHAPAPIFGYLVYANDSARMTFDEIADAIERHELFYNMTDADGAAFQAHHANVRMMMNAVA